MANPSPKRTKKAQHLADPEAFARKILAGEDFFDDPDPAAWRPAKWPSPEVAKGLGRLPNLAQYHDSAMIAALRILCDECGMREAIREHGMHAIWVADLDGDDASGIKPMPRFFYGSGSATAEWMLNAGLFSPSETAGDTPGVSHLIDAAINQKDFAVWLAKRGGNFSAPGQDSVFFHLSNMDNPLDQQIAQIAVEQGADPWQIDAKGRYPIELAIVHGHNGYAAWLLKQSRTLPDAETMRYFERLAKACGNDAVLEFIGPAATSAIERAELACASDKEDSPEAAGELALSLIKQGSLSVNGKAPENFGEFQKLAKSALAAAEKHTPRGRSKPASL